MTDGASAPNVWLWRDLKAEGWKDSVIAARVKTGEWHRIRQGAYTDGAIWRSLDPVARHRLTARAVVRQSCTPVVVSHISAAAWLGAPTWSLPLDWVHVTRRDERTGRRSAGVCQHRGHLMDGDVRVIAGLDVSSATRTALEITTIASPEPALVVVNHLLHAGATSHEALVERYAAGMDRWSFTLSTDLVLRRAEGLCESVGESRFWHFCYASAIPLPTPQYVVRDRSGHEVARLDFAWPHLRVFVEFDGMVKYRAAGLSGEAAAEVVVREKRREDAVRELTGWLCVRVTWPDLDHQDRLLARLRQAFAAAERTPVPTPGSP